MSIARKAAWSLAFLVAAITPPKGPLAGEFAAYAMQAGSTPWSRCRMDRSWLGCTWLLSTGRLGELYPAPPPAPPPPGGDSGLGTPVMGPAPLDTGRSPSPTTPPPAPLPPAPMPPAPQLPPALSPCC